VIVASDTRRTVVAPAQAAAVTLAERIRAGERVDLLVVRVGSERFALELAYVLEAVDASALEALPSLPAEALGVLRWRGAAHLVWSPSALLRAKLDGADTALFLRGLNGPGAPVALAVDDVEDLLTISGNAVRPLQGVDDGEGLVAGALHVGESLATVLDSAVLTRALAARAGDAR
jgi:chemotaxis signal transduction protein